MGLYAPEGNGDQKTWKILVTGFGPFLDNRTNPSFLIAKTLPPICKLPDCPPINITAWPHPIEVCYQTVGQLVPRLLFSKDSNSQHAARPSTQLSDALSVARAAHETPNFDIVINLGLAPGRDYYSIETCAHRDGYVRHDIHGKTLEGDTHWRDAYSAPEVLTPTYNIADVWQRWKRTLPETDVRPSNDAGRYICEYTFFAGMLEYWRRDADGRRPAMFCHVPTGSETADLERGKKVVLALIVALVQSQINKAEVHDSDSTEWIESMQLMNSNDGN